MTRTMTALAAALLAATSATAFAAGSGTQTPAPGTTTPHAMNAKQSSKSQASLPSSNQTMSARRIEEIQAALQNKGEQVATDGIWGPHTAAALRDFQKKNGLTQTGRFDQATAQKLNIPHWS